MVDLHDSTDEAIWQSIEPGTNADPRTAKPHLYSEVSIYNGRVTHRRWALAASQVSRHKVQPPARGAQYRTGA